MAPSADPPTPSCAALWRVLSVTQPRSASGSARLAHGPAGRSAGHRQDQQFIGQLPALLLELLRHGYFLTDSPRRPS